MKKFFRRALTAVLTGAMVIGAMSFTAAADEQDSYKLFIAYGGDAEAENDWGVSYDGVAGKGVTATDAEIKVGETATISLDFDAAIVNAWYFAPVLVAEGATKLDVTVVAKIDGTEIEVDPAAGDKAWWYEETGAYSKSEAIRLYGGFNEWATKYIDEEKITGASKIEYSITLNEISFDAVVEGLTESTEEYDVFVAYGGDKAEENDWGYNYAGGEAGEGITVTNGTIKSGESCTVSIEFAAASPNVWYTAPVIVASGVGEAEFVVETYVNGEQVDIDATAGDNWWYEGTGDYGNDETIRVYGGFNEWGAKYIAEPTDITKIEYKITANKIMLGGAADNEDTAPAVTVDPITTFPCNIFWTAANQPAAEYTVQTDTVYVVVTVDYLFSEEEATAKKENGEVVPYWNQWCCNGLVVTNTDGTQKFYAFGGDQVTWDVSILGGDNAEVVGGYNNGDGQYLTVDENGHGEFKLLVDGKGAKVTVYPLGWGEDSGTAGLDQYTINIVDGGTENAADNSADAETEGQDVIAPAPSSAKLPVWAIVLIAVAGVAVVAGVVVVVLKKKKN